MRQGSSDTNQGQDLIGRIARRECRGKITFRLVNRAITAQVIDLVECKVKAFARAFCQYLLALAS
jgi:hypothetical protein